MIAELDDLGLDHNAFTSHEMTVYYASGLPESILAGTDVLADILRPAPRTEDFEEERGVILEEIAMYADQPYWVLMEEAGERDFRNHPLGFRVLGTTETISKLPVDSMRRYFEHRYASDSVAVAASGNVDFGALLEKIGGACGAWKPSGAKREHPPLSPGEGEFTLRRPELSAAYGVMQMPSVDLLDPRRYEASLVAQILGDSEGSRLFWSLVETGLAEQADASFDPARRRRRDERPLGLRSRGERRGRVDRAARTRGVRGKPLRRRPRAKPREGRDLGHARRRSPCRTHAPARRELDGRPRLRDPRGGTRADRAGLASQPARVPRRLPARAADDRPPAAGGLKPEFPEAGAWRIGCLRSAAIGESPSTPHPLAEHRHA